MTEEGLWSEQAQRVFCQFSGMNDLQVFIALATGSIRALLSWLDSNSGPSEGNTKQRDLVSGR
jgi:hypothetical protein